MTYTYDNGHPPCYDHDGHAEPLIDQTKPGITTDDPIQTAIHHGDAVIGWKAACACGWKGYKVHLRADHPITDKTAHLAPDELSDIGGPIEREWRLHVQSAVPEARLRDLHNHGASAAVLAAEVQMLRVRNTPWERIAEATDITTAEAHARWGRLDLTARQVSGQDTRPTPEAFLQPLVELDALAGPNSVHSDPDQAVVAVKSATMGLTSILTSTNIQDMDQGIYSIERALDAAYAARAHRFGAQQVNTRAWGDQINGLGNLDTGINHVLVESQSVHSRSPETTRIEWDGVTENEMALQIKVDTEWLHPTEIDDPVLHQRLEYALRIIVDAIELVSQCDEDDEY